VIEDPDARDEDHEEGQHADPGRRDVDVEDALDRPLEAVLGGVEERAGEQDDHRRAGRDGVPAQPAIAAG
jgi:hypothetical protein